MKYQTWIPAATFMSKPDLYEKFQTQKLNMDYHLQQQMSINSYNMIVFLLNALKCKIITGFLQITPSKIQTPYHPAKDLG